MHVSFARAQNGRIKGDAKKALRGVIEQYGIPVTLSANQNILLRDVEPAWREDIQARLEVSLKQQLSCPTVEAAFCI